MRIVEYLKSFFCLLALFCGFFLCRFSFAADKVDYLIITSRHLKISNVFQPLISAKTARGLRVVVETVENINQTMSGRDTQEKIRNFIKQKYTDNGLTWVLLGGDTNIVPARFVAIDGYGEAVSDMYYSDLDGDWDANANNRFGEFQDSLDLYPDVFVGRAPVENEIEAQTFVNKVLAYEANAHNYAEKILLLGHSAHNDEGYRINELIASEYMAEGFAITKYYQRDIPAYRDLTINAINAGQNIINHIGYGAIETLGTGSDMLTISDIDGLTNTSTPAILVSGGCNAAAIDFDAIAEHWITNPNGGGVAFVGNSRTGLIPESEDYLNPSFFESLLRKGIVHIGQCLADSKIAFIGEANSYSTIRFAMLELNLLGDPEMAMQINAAAINITSPKNTGYVHGQVEISGSAFQKDFQRYELSYAPVAKPDNTTLICSSMDSVKNGLLTKSGPWDTTQCPDGQYLLILKIITQEGKTISCRNDFKVIVDNINQPPEFSYLRNRGAVINRPLEFRVLVTDPDDPQTPWGQVRISADNLPLGAQFNPDNQLFSWQPAETERGTYRVNFTVRDSEYAITKTVIISTVDLEETQIASGPISSPSLYDNKVAWVDDSRSGNSDIYLYDLSNRQETAVCTIQAALRTSASIEKDKIFWREVGYDGRENLYMYDIPTQQTVLLYALPSSTNWRGNFSFHDGKAVWIEETSYPFDEVHLYDFSQRQEKIISTAQSLKASIAISRDKIVWSDRRNGNNDIYMYDLALGKETQVTNNSASQLNPAIHKDRIVWNDFRNGRNSNIYTYDLLTGKETQISFNYEYETSPDIYEDKIIYRVNHGGYRNIFMYDLSNGLETQITYNAFPTDIRIYGNRIVWLDWDYLFNSERIALCVATFKLQNTVPPVITLTSPQEDGIYNGSITIAGTVADDSSEINSVFISVDNTTPLEVPVQNGQFSYQLSNIAEGKASITLTATDDSRNKASKVVHVTIDLTKPVISVTSPTGPVYTNSPELKGRVSEKLRNNKITITCTDNSAIVLATINKNLGWILPAGVLKLKEGKNHLRLTGYDLAGNPAKDCLFTIVYIPQIKTGQLSGRIYGFKLWPWQLIEPLANADILIKGKGITKQTKSDHNGYYNIKDLPEGKYTVNVYRLSYTPQIRIIYITPNKTTLANFYLRKLNWLGHTLVSRQK